MRDKTEFRRGDSLLYFVHFFESKNEFCVRSSRFSNCRVSIARPAVGHQLSLFDECLRRHEVRKSQGDSAVVIITQAARAARQSS